MMLPVRLLTTSLFVLALLAGAGNRLVRAQSIGGLSGIVVDQTGALIGGAEITILNYSGTLERTVVTDAEGFFSFPFLPPDEYSLKITKEGFDPAEVPNLTVAEGAARRFKIELKISSITESVKVQDAAEAVEEAATATNAFDRRFVESFPLNGRGLQSLVNLVPGVVLTPVDNFHLGQFSVNGQRTNANFFTVDGVSANFGTTNYDFLGQTGSGSLPARSIQGGLDNLVPAEALREMTVETLAFAPSQGRLPGATVAFYSRAGGADFALSLFENFRHAAFNARDYFDPEKPPHQLHDFGGSFGGPLFGREASRSKYLRSYFFLTFEGKRFTLPQPTVVAEVPSVDLRKETQNPAAQAIYNAFPLPNEKDDQAMAGLWPNISSQSEAAPLGFPQTELFRATYADPYRAENYNLRLDAEAGAKLSFFGRFNYAPSASESRNPMNLSYYTASEQTTRTLTLGATQRLTGGLVNELRFNLSRQTGRTTHDFDGRYGGRRPDQTIFVPSRLDSDRTYFRVSLNDFPTPLVFFSGNFAANEMRQLNVADHFSLTAGRHAIKFGVDYRELTPTLQAYAYGIEYDFDTVAAVTAGTASRVGFAKNPRVKTRVVSISSYVQDNWRLTSRLNLLYGLRWEINPAPASAGGEPLMTLAAPPDLAVADQSGLRTAPAGTPYYRTDFRRLAPRLSAAVSLFERNGTQLIVRGGAGTFYDLGQSQFNEITSPFAHANEFAENLALPVNNLPVDFLTDAAAPGKRHSIVSAARDYRLPRTYFWNLTGQLKTGGELFSFAYVGGAGRRLQRTLTLNLAKPGETDQGYFSSDFSKIIYVDNAYSSDYHAFQFQYARALTNGFRSFVNYTWAHSIDDSSTDVNLRTPFLNYPVGLDRADSDFDLRHSFNVGFSYDLPRLKAAGRLAGLTEAWTFAGIFYARTGLPYGVKIAEYNPLFHNFEIRRPDLVEGIAPQERSAESPTGTRLNAAAFARPAEDGKQGNLPRNAFTGPGAWQFDASLAKKIKLPADSVLQLRVEVYNLFNHPVFAAPQATIFYRNEAPVIPRQFGLPSQTMARGYAAAVPTGGLSPVFQSGGARALQFSVRYSF